MKLAVGIIIALIAGAFIGFQFAPRTDTSELEGTIDLLLKEVDASNQLIEDAKTQVKELEAGIDELEAELNEKQDELDSIYRLINITGCWEHDPEWNATVIETPLKVVYQLQNYDLDALEAAGADLYIIDYSREGDEETRFTREEVQRLQSVTPDGKVLSYLSIGEAEDYRWYWDEGWMYSGPFWLGPQNPEWEGNYNVWYWDTGWQNITFTYIDRIMDSGFDGVYLDLIDAYEYWGPDGESWLERETAEQDMVDFVIVISEYAKARDPEFLIYPQNGEALAVHPEYIEAVDGIGREDVWYNDDELQTDTNTTLSYLKLFSYVGKLVIVIDYPTEEALIIDFCEKAGELGYIPYPGGRELDGIRECP